MTQHTKHTNPPDERLSAVALAYQQGSGAPKVVAQGRGLLAEAIIEHARQCGLHVHQSSELVALLMRVDLDQEIPPALYRAVAELLAWLYRIDTRISPPKKPHSDQRP